MLVGHVGTCVTMPTVHSSAFFNKTASQSPSLICHKTLAHEVVVAGTIVLMSDEGDVEDKTSNNVYGHQHKAGWLDECLHGPLNKGIQNPLNSSDGGDNRDDSRGSNNDDPLQDNSL